MPVSDKEQQQINRLVAQFETDTGIQAVAAVVRKADAYPEIPWKAYAIGRSQRKGRLRRETLVSLCS